MFVSVWDSAQECSEFQGLLHGSARLEHTHVLRSRCARSGLSVVSRRRWAPWAGGEPWGGGEPEVAHPPRNSGG